MDYTDFCDISLLGDVTQGQIRDFQVRESVNDAPEKMDENEVMIETLKQRDHILIRMFLADKIREYTKKLDISFHAMSLPASRRLWHCPYVIIYASENGMVDGPGYREFVQVRLDGESWSEDPSSINKMKTSYDETFENWDTWKKANREGLDCKIQIEKEGNKIYIETEDGGIHIHNVTTISEDVLPQLYCALTGDQVAITTICIQEFS